MASASQLFGESQPAFAFPQSLTDKYQPATFTAFAGLAKPKAIFTKFAANPYSSNWLFLGPSGTGKTTFAMAICNAIAGELHHIGSQECNVESLERVRHSCQYVPMAGRRFHVVLVDEADQMSAAAQLKLLSFLDGTDQAPNTIWIFTCNDVARLQDRFISRCKAIEFTSYGMAADATQLLARIWEQESAGAPAPNFARIVKESNNNIRESLNRLETELLAA